MRYNKNMQELMYINLYHYKTLSGKYIMKELNGQTKEYDGKTDKLIYEDEFIYDKRIIKKFKIKHLNGELIFEVN